MLTTPGKRWQRFTSGATAACGLALLTLVGVHNAAAQVDPPAQPSQENGTPAWTCADPNSGPETMCVLTPGLETYGYLASQTDSNWYRFDTTDPNLAASITLSNLAADYDLYLVDTDANVLAQAPSLGLTNKSIDVVLQHAGPYFVYVLADATRDVVVQPDAPYDLWLTLGETAAPTPPDPEVVLTPSPTPDPDAVTTPSPTPTMRIMQQATALPAAPIQSTPVQTIVVRTPTPKPTIQPTATPTATATTQATPTATPTPTPTPVPAVVASPSPTLTPVIIAPSNPPPTPTETPKSSAPVAVATVSANGKVIAPGQPTPCCGGDRDKLFVAPPHLDPQQLQQVQPPGR